ncbi:hypothetical protein TYRP_020457 [Tyrophagus putrescentiae]|nr:hypothetical protein TYRP_020457 [Tyrophagus putrescentiae]
MACPMSTVIGGSFEQFNRKGSKRPTYPVTVASCQQTNASTAPTAPVLSLPPWFDQARFDQARSILSDHFMSIFLCHLSGLVLLVFIKSIYATLALSGKSRDLVSIFYRYLHTLMHVKLWYEGRVYEATDDAHHSLLRVVGMHRSVAELQNRHRKEGEDRLALSQRDMALTQFAFIGLIVLHPEKMGFPERYNLCSGDLPTVRANCALIWEGKFRHRLQAEKWRKEAAEMSEQIVLSASHYVWLLRYRGLLRFLFEVTGLTTSSNEALIGRLNAAETFFYQALKFTVGTLVHYRIFALFFNNLLRFAFYRVITSKSFVSGIVRSLEGLQNRYYL